MLNKYQLNLLPCRLIKVYFILILFCFFSQSLIAEPLALVKINAEKETASSIPEKIDDVSELLIYAKRLQVQSQIIAKDYFYISQGLRVEKATVEIDESAQDIDNILSIFTVSIKNQEIQNLLNYLNTINAESKEIFNEKFSKENASLIVDYSETLYEGSQSIIDYLSGKTTNSNSFHDDILREQLALQRISKFYIAYQVGFNDETMFNKLTESIKTFEDGLDTINSHKFVSDEQELASTRLKHYWFISKKFYEGMEKGELTLIVSVSTDHMMSYLDKILRLEK